MVTLTATRPRPATLSPPGHGQGPTWEGDTWEGDTWSLDTLGGDPMGGEARVDRHRRQVVAEQSAPDTSPAEHGRRHVCSVDTDVWSEDFPWLSHPQIPRTITRLEHWKVLKLVETVRDIFRQNGIQFFVYGGSLLGSLVFHDMIPWDDDVDLAVAARDRDAAFAALAFSGRPEYSVHFMPDRRFLKFFHANSRRSRPWLEWPYTFVDVFFYQENATHIWETDRRFFGEFPKEVVFPLHLRPFSWLWLPAPRDGYLMSVIRMDTFTKSTSSYRTVYKSHGAVDSQHGEFLCQTGKRDHRLEQNMRTVTRVDCSSTLPYYPVVHVLPAIDGNSSDGNRHTSRTTTNGYTNGSIRHTSRNTASGCTNGSIRRGTGTRDSDVGVREVLMFAGKVLRDCLILEPAYAVRKPLSLSIV